jgi:WhiB family redox-sensing transcriptional regulator
MTGYRLSPGAVSGTTTPREPTADWRDSAACLEEDPELFFPVGTMPHAVAQIEEAKDVCRRCEVQDTCRRWALETRQEFGVWGGLSESERIRVRRTARAAAAPMPVPIKADPTARSVCGSGSGYVEHTRKHERQCEACRAWRAGVRQRRNLAS